MKLVYRCYSIAVAERVEDETKSVIMAEEKIALEGGSMDANQYVIQTISQILTSLMVIVASISLIMTIRLTRWNKKNEITSTYLARYGELLRDLDSVRSGVVDLQSFWHRFWFFHQEQYILWKQGVIDKDLYQLWMDYRAKEWKDNEVIRGVSYQDSWKEVCRQLTDEFCNFMKAVFSKQRPTKYIH